MVSVRRHARDRRAYLARGGLVLALTVTVPPASAIGRSQPPAPARGIEDAQKDRQSGQVRGAAASEQKATQPLTADAADGTDKKPSAKGSNSSGFWKTLEKDASEPDWWVAVGTGLLVLVTGVLATFTYWLWRETKRAVADTAMSIKIASDSVKAAHRSADAAERASHVERAWVFFEEVIQGLTNNGYIDNIPYGPGHHFTVKWKNGGRTPAVGVISYVNYRIIDLTENIPVFECKMPEGIGRGILGQDKVCNTTTLYIPMDKMRDVLERKNRLLVYSKFEYFDVFNSSILRTSEVVVHVDYNGTQYDESHRLVPRVLFGIVGKQTACT